jgi:hypothetical protein
MAPYPLIANEIRTLKKKRILIVSRSFYPMNSPRSFRTTELVKEFARQGHEVTLLTLKNEEFHKPFEDQFGVTIKHLGDLTFPGIPIPEKKGVGHYAMRILSRGLYLFFEYPAIELMFRVRKALRKEGDYDLMITIAMPHTTHWGAALARKKDHPIAGFWAADCGDPYMGQTLDTFNKMFYFSYFEKLFCRKADAITVPIEEAKNGYYPEFRDKIEVIPQGFNFDDMKIDKNAYVKNDVPTFAYAGSLIPGGRDPRSFLDFLIDLEEDYRFILYTKSLDLVQPWAERSKGRIEIRDFIPRNVLLEKLSKMDFLVNFENRSSLMAPSKLIDYHLTGRPVFSVSGDQFDQDNFTRFLKGDYRDKMAIQNLDRYRIENVCAKFLELESSL